MRQKQGVFSLFLLSPSSRRAWIEITIEPSSCLYFKSPSSRRAWIEINFDKIENRVLSQSPSSRRAWIEMVTVCTEPLIRLVALLAEGVDRNFGDGVGVRGDGGRPPRGGRG